LKKLPGPKPVVVVDVNLPASSADLLKVVSTFAKSLTADGLVAHCLVVLSDARATFGLTVDENRRETLWVEDFTHAEAHMYFDNREFLCSGVTDNLLREKLFSQCGTRGALLRRAADKGVDLLGAKIAEMKKFAENDILRLTTRGHSDPKQNGAAFAKLIRLLLATTDEIGVPEKLVDKYLPEPKETTKLLKENHALMFHLPSSSYRFYSPAHRHAAVEWAAENPEVCVLPHCVFFPI
jgi:hypothetical protein